MSIKHWPKDERPREKLLQKGAEALSDAELLAILLRVGTQGMSAVDLARSLLQQFGGLSALMSAPLPELSQHKGMGLASFAQFNVVRELGRRMLEEEFRTPEHMTHPDAVGRYLRLHLGAKPVEVMLGLMLNQQHQLLAVEEFSRGSLSDNTVYIREMVKSCLKRDAAALILAHNHPGGGASPSVEDQRLTLRVETAMALMDIRLIDHFIVTRSAALSMRQNGWWPQ